MIIYAEYTLPLILSDKNEIRNVENTIMAQWSLIILRNMLSFGFSHWEKQS